MLLASGCTTDSEPSTSETQGALSHPYLLLTEDRRTTIESNLENPQMAAIFERMQQVAAGELRTPLPGTWDAKLHGDNAEVAEANALIAWLESDQEAANRAMAAMELLETNWEDHTVWGINIKMPETLMHYTAAWDLLSGTDFFPEEKATALKTKLLTITEKFYDYYILDPFMRDLSLGVSQNNHPIRTAACIGLVALAFLGEAHTQAWLDWAVSELDYLFSVEGQYVQPDGGISEGPFYFSFGFAPTVAFFIALDNATQPETIYTRNCINRSDADPWSGHNCIDGESFTFSSPLRDSLTHSILDWSLALRLPTGHRAPIADAPLRHQAAQALFVHYGAPTHHLWDWQTNPDDPYKVRGGHNLSLQHLAYVRPDESVSPPEWKNRFMPQAGMASFRSGWTPQDRMLVLMGENGSARKTLHDHVDGTSFVLAAYGDLLITDTGYYKPSQSNNAVTANASSHNVILIDGKGAPDKGLLNSWGDADAFIENTLESSVLAYAESRQTYEDTTIVRSVAFVRERYFVVSDHLSSENTEAREYRFRLHAFAGYDLDGGVTLESHGPHIQRADGSLQVFTTSTAGNPTIEEPPYIRLQAPHAHSLIAGEGEGDHTVIDATLTTVTPSFLTILAPYQSNATEGDHAPLSVTPVNIENGAAWIVRSDTGDEELIWMREDGSPNLLTLPEGATIESDGRLSIVSLNKSFGLLSRGTSLTLNGQELIGAGNPQGVQSTP